MRGFNGLKQLMLSALAFFLQKLYIADSSLYSCFLYAYWATLFTFLSLRLLISLYSISFASLTSLNYSSVLSRHAFTICNTVRIVLISVSKGWILFDSGVVFWRFYSVNSSVFREKFITFLVKRVLIH